MTDIREEELVEWVNFVAQNIKNNAAYVMSERQGRVSYREVLAGLDAYFYREGEMDELNSFIYDRTRGSLENAFNTPIRWTKKGKANEVTKASGIAFMLAMMDLNKSTGLSKEC